MNIYLKIAIACCFLGGIQSCKDNLDEKVYSLVTESNYAYSAKDFDPTVVSVYSYFRSLIGHDHFWATQEMSSDEIVNPPNSSGWDDGGIYRMLHYHKWTSEQPHVKDMWNTFYRGVVLSNSVIALINSDKLPAGSADQKRMGIAELRAVRAYFYWLICDNFGDAPLFTEPTYDLPSKNSRKEIYQFIVNELTEVIPDLSEVQGGTSYGRMNKWAAKSLLANVFLNAEVYSGENHWEDCLAQCNDITNSGKCELSPDFKDNFRTTGTESSKEIIFTIPFDKTLAGGNYIHMFSWHGQLQKKFNLEATPWGSGSSMGVTQFVDTYQAEDTRLVDTWLMGDQYASDGSLLLCTYDMKGQPLSFKKEVLSGNYTNETDGYRMFKYEVAPGTPWVSSTDYPLFRYSEILLMKAECLLRTGKSGAGALVTQVRQRNFKNDPANAVVTDDELANNSSYKYGFVENYKIVRDGNTDPVKFGRMLDELGWEFAWEMHRRRDMIRYGVYTKKSWLSHEPQGDFRTVFPIPESSLTSNPKLQQNPDYLAN